MMTLYAECLCGHEREQHEHDEVCDVCPCEIFLPSAVDLEEET